MPEKISLVFVFLPLAFLLVLHTRNNTDSIKLMMFFGIPLYYGDTYTVPPQGTCIYLKIVIDTTNIADIYQQ